METAMKLTCAAALSGMFVISTAGRAQTAPATSPASGREMFVTYCASCHGRQGRGDGPAAAALKKPPANLTMLSANNGGKFPEVRVLSAIRGDANLPAHGSAAMPVWGRVFQSMSPGNPAEVEMRLSNLVAYIRSIQTK